jgi:hypothetical protein
VAGAGEGPAEVEKDVEEHQDTEIVLTRSPGLDSAVPSRHLVKFVLQVQGVGSFAQRYHVDQPPRTQIKRKGNSGDDLHRTAGPSLR